jgi:hypothetical protein
MLIHNNAKNPKFFQTFKYSGKKVLFLYKYVFSIMWLVYLTAASNMHW